MNNFNSNNPINYNSMINYWIVYNLINHELINYELMNNYLKLQINEQEGK